MVGVPLGETTRPPVSVTVPAIILLVYVNSGVELAKSTGINIVPDAGAVYDFNDILFI